MVLNAAVSSFNDGGRHTVYVTNVATGGISWDLRIRYSRFDAFYKAIKSDVAGLPFPGQYISFLAFTLRLTHGVADRKGWSF